MSVWEYLRTKRIWIGIGVSTALLLILWGIGALLIEKGFLPVKMHAGWIAASCFCAGLAGSCIASEKKKNPWICALILTVILVAAELIWSVILFGGISFRGGAWKNLLSVLAGGILAGFLCKGKRGGRVKRKKNRKANVRLPKKW